MDTLLNHHIEETRRRLERIENKLDGLAETKIHVKLLVFSLSVIVSIVTTLFVTALK